MFLLIFAAVPNLLGILILSYTKADVLKVR